MPIALWLFATPWLFSGIHAGTAAWSFWIVGSLIAAFAILNIWAFELWKELMIVILGLWMACSPLLIGFTAAAPRLSWNAALAGGLVTAFAIWNIIQQTRTGQTSLWR